MTARAPEPRCACQSNPIRDAGDPSVCLCACHKPAPEPSGRPSGEDFERLIEHDRYESMTRLNECKLVVEARRARTSEAALLRLLQEAAYFMLPKDAEDFLTRAAALRGKT